MEDTHDFYNLFSSYWWLLFPLGWAIGALIKTWMRHNQAKEALALLKSYIDQGKEPPPELLAVLRQPEPVRRDRRLRPLHFFIGGWLFAATAIAFCVLVYARMTDKDWDSLMGLLFVVVLMGLLAVGLFVTGWMTSRDQNSLPPP